jgi:hypothetical protein
MGYIASIITGVIGTGIKLLGSSGGPQYPAPPKINKLPVAKAQAQMEAYEAQRQAASIQAWKDRFPLLYKGGQYMVDSIARNQAGYLSGNIENAITKSGLEMPKEGNQRKLAKDIGLSPIALSQRTSEAVTRQIAANPETSNEISGGTLATMLANSYQNQNAFNQFLGANRTAQYIAGQAGSSYNTAAILGGLTGAANIAASYSVYNNQFGPLSPYGQGVYSTPAYSTPTTLPGGYGQQPQGGTPATQPYYDPTATYSNAMTAGPNYGSPYGTDYYGNTMGGYYG